MLDACTTSQMWKHSSAFIWATTNYISNPSNPGSDTCIASSQHSPAASAPLPKQHNLGSCTGQSHVLPVLAVQPWTSEKLCLMQRREQPPNLAAVAAVRMNLTAWASDHCCLPAGQLVLLVCWSEAATELLVPSLGVIEGHTRTPAEQPADSQAKRTQQ